MIWVYRCLALPDRNPSNDRSGRESPYIGFSTRFERALLGMSTFIASAEKAIASSRWHIIDADGRVLGRIATTAARLLQGKHKPIYTPFIDTGDHVVIAVPGLATRDQIISPLLIHQAIRKRFGTLISEVAGSGSGVFDVERKCLLGIISRAIPKYDYQEQDGKFIAEPAGHAGYFVPASEIAEFIPAEFRFPP